MNNDIAIVDGRLVVEPVGMDRFWGLRRRIVVPLGQVRGARYEPEAARLRKGIRAPGLEIPWFKWVGTFYRRGEKSYWNVRAGGQTVVVDLEGAAFTRLYLTVDDARGVADRINEAVKA